MNSAFTDSAFTDSSAIDSASVTAPPTRPGRSERAAAGSGGPMARRSALRAGIALLAAGATAAVVAGAATSANQAPSSTPGGSRPAPGTRSGSAPKKASLADAERRRTVSQSPAAANPAVDRDASFVASTRQQPGAMGRQATGPAAAAAVTVATGTADSLETHTHLLSRATFGPRVSDYAALAAQGIDAWLSAQLDPAALADPDGDRAWSAFPLARLNITEVRGAVKEFEWDAAEQTGQATLAAQVFSERQLFEVVADVFTNLLNVTTPSDSVWASGPDYARTVIRAHAFGRYADMLHAAMRHPAMLTYLNNNESTKTDVNENLGRELLELHTLGVASGYTETDVRNSANILSGRGIDWETSLFYYDESNHFTGPVSTAWFSHPNATGGGGLAVGDAFVDSLAKHPATAVTVARKLAVRFVSDSPPQSIIDRLAATYLENDTQIVPVLRVLFSSTEFWAAPKAKWRRPLEDAVGSARAIGVIASNDLAAGVKDLYWAVQSMGQAPLSWIPPNGYPDVTAAWKSASQMVSRWNLHRGLADGWWKGLTPPQKLSKELVPVAGQTYAQWVDIIAVRVIGRPLTPEHNAVLTSYLGVDGGAEADSGDSWQAPQLAALILDSPHFQLR
ncbi:DUF1800 domain-containing protein [Salinibacterium sp.]|uniref:DUF1800 domain-containing protein n=1 Tax=Salinibacterium sp. TaxID=1915057 RepID=UPI00286B5A42|nr:DUF1800 domain-containing protein [Salinibacterium sp.]